MLAKADKGELRGLLAELGACRAGLTRENLVRATGKLADRSMLGLAWECLQEMGRREMKPSLAAHNKLLDAYARKGRWDLGMRTLLRMQQLGLHPDERSFAAAIRAGVGAPGSAQLAEALRPQLEAAARRETQSNAKTADPKRVLLQPSSSADPHAGAVTIHAASAAAILEAQGSERSSGRRDAGSGASGVSGLRMLQGHLATGKPPHAAVFKAAMIGCARAPDRWREALQIQSMMELWIREEPERAHHDDVAEIFAAAIQACDRSQQKDAALSLLTRMQDLEVRPLVAAYAAAIRACRHGDADVSTARMLMQRMRRLQIGPDTNAYNSFISVLASAGGMGEVALSTLEEMRREKVEPDAYTYACVITACKPTHQQHLALSAAAAQQRQSVRGPAVPRSFLGTTRHGPHHTAAAPPDSVTSPDGGVWRDGVPPWERALSLLPEMRLRGVPRDQKYARVYGAAIELCERCSDLDGALSLLLEMPQEGFRPDGFALGMTATAAARQGQASVALRILHETEAEVARQREAQGLQSAGPQSCKPMRSRQYEAPTSASLGLFSVSNIAIAGAPAGAPVGKVARSRLHETCILASAKGNATPLPLALAMPHVMRARGLTPSKFAFDFALTACMRRNAWREGIGVLNAQRDAGYEPSTGQIASLLRTFGRADIGPTWSSVVPLLDDVVERGLTLPAASQLHIAQTGVQSGAGLDAVRQLERIEFVGGTLLWATPREQSHGAPKPGGNASGRAKQSIATQLQGELFCAAAQDGTEPDMLPSLLSKLKREKAAPTLKLLHRALAACRRGRDQKESWRHIPTLLQLAKRERMSLSEKAFILAVETYLPGDHAGMHCSSPATVLNDAASTRLQRNHIGADAVKATMALVCDVQSALHVPAVSEGGMEKLKIICQRSIDGTRHARMLVDQLIAPTELRKRNGVAVAQHGGILVHAEPKGTEGVVNGVHGITSNPMISDEAMTRTQGATICTLVARLAARQEVTQAARRQVEDVDA